MQTLNPDLFISLPFPMPATAEAEHWLAELDFTDVHFGNLKELKALADTAPNTEATAWLRGLVAMRQHIEVFQPVRH